MSSTPEEIEYKPIQKPKKEKRKESCEDNGLLLSEDDDFDLSDEDLETASLIGNHSSCGCNEC